MSLQYKIRSILIAGLLAGTMDITAAIIQTLLANGSILRLFQYIASGVAGKPSFDGGFATAIMGLFLHYFIAMMWTWLYFSCFPKVSLFQKNWILSGFVFGVIVWVGMNRVVLPLSRVSQFPFRLDRAAIAMAILIVCIGLPVSYFANRYFKPK